MNPTGGLLRGGILYPGEPPLVTRYFHEVTFAENFELSAIINTNDEQTFINIAAIAG